jgi:hypothetical protein
VSKYPLELLLGVPVQSQNAFKHWRTRQKERQMWEKTIRAYWGKAEPATARMRLVITRVLGPRERLFDDGNGEGGSCKQIVDAIKRLGWVRDDSPKHLTWEFRQEANLRHLGPAVELRFEPERGIEITEVAA